MAAEKNTARLIARFEHDGKQHRLLSRGKWNSNYEDEYVVESLGTDGLGDPKWEPRFSWMAKGSNDHCNTLISALKAAQREQRGDVVEKIAAYVRDTFADGAPIADAILEGRFE